ASAPVVPVVLAVSGALLDPGDRRDPEPDAPPAPLAPQAPPARAFTVDPAASRVDFTAQVAGVALNGVFPVQSGTITLEPVEEMLQVHVSLQIGVDGLETD